MLIDTPILEGWRRVNVAYVHLFIQKQRKEQVPTLFAVTLTFSIPGMN